MILSHENPLMNDLLKMIARGDLPAPYIGFYKDARTNGIFMHGGRESVRRWLSQPIILEQN
jgi:hypothetical protein